MSRHSGFTLLPASSACTTRRKMLGMLGAVGLLTASGSVAPRGAAAYRMGQSVEDIKERLKQWIINPYGPGGDVLSKQSFDGAPERNYSLLGTDPDSPETFLSWEEQTWGINLGWTDGDDPDTEAKVRRWFFAQENGDGPVHYGDLVGLGYGTSPSFLYYTSRDVGINLDWDDDPVYEWKILGGTVGEPVPTQERVAILNTSTNDEGGEPLIYFNRTAGANIGWPSSQTWLEAVGIDRESVIEAIKDMITKQAGESGE